MQCVAVKIVVKFGATNYTKMAQSGGELSLHRLLIKLPLFEKAYLTPIRNQTIIFNCSPIYTLTMELFNRRRRMLVYALVVFMKLQDNRDSA